jgi:hypothetical protein
MGGGGGVNETPAQAAMAEHARNLMQDYKQRWLPVQQNLAKQITASGEAGSSQRKQAAGMASADVEGKFAGAERGLEAKLTATGALPGSSKSNLAISGIGLDKATSKGMATTISDQHIDEAYTRGLTALMQTGRGERATVGNSMAQQAATSGQQAGMDARMALDERAGNAQLGATAVGMGMQQYLKPASTGPNWAGDSYDYRGSSMPSGMGGNRGGG